MPVELKVGDLAPEFRAQAIGGTVRRRAKQFRSRISAVRSSFFIFIRKMTRRDVPFRPVACAMPGAN